MDISIIVVSYNTRQLVADCLASVERHLEGRTDYEVIVVDNASKDGTPEWLIDYARHRPRLIVHCSGENLGFSGGNNAGLRLSTGRNVLLLNSDAYLVDDSAVAAMAYLDSRADVGCVACLLLTEDGGRGPSYGFFPTARILAWEILTRRFAGLRAVCPAEGEPTHEIDFPCGAFFLMKGSLMRELQGMDTDFFMYYEETDLAKRARDRGYKSVYFGGARAVHLGGQSTREVKSLFLTRMFYGNWRRYLRKHHGPAARGMVRMMLEGYYLSALLAHRLRGNRLLAGYFRDHLRALHQGWSGKAQPLQGPRP